MPIATWLQSLGLEQYTAAFETNDITDSLLPSLTARDLRDIGVTSVGHRRRMLDAIAARAGPHPASSFTGPEPTPERRQITVMFCDLVGSTALSVRLDPEDLSTLTKDYQNHVTGIVHRHGGFIARFLGDGVLIYFGWPAARDVDAERAIHAALDVVAAIGKTPIRGERLRVRIGIATGLVVIGERIGAGDSLQHTAIGETPNRAARLQSIASPDTIVIDAPTRAMVGRLFDLRDIGPHELPGLAGPIPAWTVAGESGVLSRFEALHGASLTPFVGRNEELSLLLRQWSEAKSGRGNVVLLTGEPGIGKSRLTAALDEHLHGLPHFSLRYFCGPNRRDTPLAPIIGQWQHAAGFARGDTAADKLAKLRQILVPRTTAEDTAIIAAMLSLPPDAAMPALELPAHRRKEWIFSALARQLAALTQLQPVVILAEDVHWSDPTSREFLGHLIEILPKLPVLMIMTFRPEFEPPWKGHECIHQMTLNSLPQKDTAAMALQLAASAIPRALIDRLAAHSGGVPLFIEELMRTVLETGLDLDAPASVRVPANLRASLLARLDRLPAAKAVAQIGSVIGRSFGHDVFASITDLPVRTWEEGLTQLVDAGMLRRGGEPPGVTYQFKHQLVQDAAYQSMLRPRRATLHAAVLSALEDDSTADPALLAHHGIEAGDHWKAVTFLLAAAEQSSARGAWNEAHTQLTRGLKLAEDNPDIAGVQALRTRYQLALGEVIGALRFYASPESGQALAAAVTLARDLPIDEPARDALLARSLFGTIVHVLYLGDFRLVRALAGELLVLGRERGNFGIATLGSLATGICQVYQGELQAAREIFSSTLTAWEAIDRPSENPAGGSAVARALGLDPIAVLMGFRARTDALLGYPDTAVADARRSVLRARSLHHVRSLAITLGTAWDTFLIAGEDADLRQATADWDELAREQGFQFYLTRAQYCSGWMRVRDGDIAAGRALIETAMAELEDAGAIHDGPQVYVMLAGARLADGDRDGASAAIARGLEIAAGNGGVWWNAELHLLEARLLDDQPIQAEAAFRLGLKAAERMASPAQTLLVATHYAGFLLKAGRGGEGRALLAPALASFTEGSDRADQRAAAELLIRIGG